MGWLLSTDNAFRKPGPPGTGAASTTGPDDPIQLSVLYPHGRFVEAG
jgi:hypothetical protein